jgi:hypothetical protein
MNFRYSLDNFQDMTMDIDVGTVLDCYNNTDTETDTNWHWNTIDKDIYTNMDSGHGQDNFSGHYTKNKSVEKVTIFL